LLSKRFKVRGVWIFWCNKDDIISFFGVVINTGSDFLDSRFHGNDWEIFFMDSRFRGNDWEIFFLDSRFHGNDGFSMSAS